MTESDARRLIGNQPVTCVRNMIAALQMCPSLNTPEDWQRLEAAKIWLAARQDKRRAKPKRTKH